MILKVQAKALNEKLSKLVVVFDKQSSDPVFSNVKVSVDSDRMTITGTNRKVCVSEYIDKGFYVDSAFSFMVDAATFISFMKKQKSGEVSIEISDDFKSMTIAYPTGEYRCACERADNFPEVFKCGIEDWVSLNMMDYVSVMKKASEYTMVAEFIQGIDNVVIDIDEKHINVVSTDRNMIYRYSVPNTDGIKPSFIPVSSQSAVILDKHISKSDDIIRIGVDDKRTFFSIEDADMSEIHFEGKYPNWRKVLEFFNGDSVYVFSRELLIKSLSNMLKVDPYDYIHLAFTEKGCGVAAEDTAKGRSCKERLTAFSSVGEISCTVVCARFLAAVKSVTCDRVVMEHDNRNHFNKVYGEGKPEEVILFSSIVF